VFCNSAKRLFEFKKDLQTILKHLQQRIFFKPEHLPNVAISKNNFGQKYLKKE
jgi:hypothetical protein